MQISQFNLVVMAITTKITIQALVKAPISKVWASWNDPKDIIQWNAADPSWHCTASENDLTVGGKFKHRMEAKDGSYGFDFEGEYDQIKPLQEISYTMSDGRSVTTWFAEEDGMTTVTSTFDAETENNPEMQKQGWQAILDNFAKYVSSAGRTN